MPPDDPSIQYSNNNHPLHPLPAIGRTFFAGFESTYQPAAGVDALEVTAHAEHWAHDLDQVLAAGVRHLRYPLRWQRIEREPGVFDWDETDRVLGHLRERGAVPVVDLVHHTSYPDWLSDGLRGAGRDPLSLAAGVHPVQRAVRDAVPGRPPGAVAPVRPRPAGAAPVAPV